MAGRAGTIALSQAVAAERQTDVIQTRFWICSRGSHARVGAGAVVHEVRQGPWEEVWQRRQWKGARVCFGSQFEGAGHHGHKGMVAGM